MRFVLLGLLLLIAACDSRTPKDFAEEKAAYAERVDNLALCKIFADEEDFMAQGEICRRFFEQNTFCSVFAEKKYGCSDFLNSNEYKYKKIKCTTFKQRSKRCKGIYVSEEPFFAIQWDDNPWLKKIADFYELNVEEEPWYEKIKREADENPDLVVGVVVSGYQKTSFRQGLELGVDEINEKGGVLNRNFRIFVYDDDGDVNKSREFAKKMQHNPRIGIVIGRQYSSNTIPVTFMYERSKMLYLSASATNQRVIRHGMQFIFRLLPNNSQAAEKASQFALHQNYKKMVLINTRDDYNDELSQAFYDFSVKNGEIEFVYQKSFFDSKLNFSDIVSELRQLDFDAIFLATGVDTAVGFIKQARKMGIKQPFIGTDGLDSIPFVKKLGADADNIIVPSIYDVNATTDSNVHFVTRFQKKHGNYPNTWSAQGYDAIHLLATAIRIVNSTVPEQVASALRYQVSRMGSTGLYQFEVTGELVEQDVYFKKLEQGEFEIIEKSLAHNEEKVADDDANKSEKVAE